MLGEWQFLRCSLWLCTLWSFPVQFTCLAVTFPVHWKRFSSRFPVLSHFTAFSPIVLHFIATYQIQENAGFGLYWCFKLMKRAMIFTSKQVKCDGTGTGGRKREISKNPTFFFIFILSHPVPSYPASRNSVEHLWAGGSQLRPLEPSAQLSPALETGEKKKNSKIWILFILGCYSMNNNLPVVGALTFACIWPLWRAMMSSIEPFKVLLTSLTLCVSTDGLLLYSGGIPIILPPCAESPLWCLGLC